MVFSTHFITSSSPLSLKTLSSRRPCLWRIFLGLERSHPHPLDRICCGNIAAQPYAPQLPISAINAYQHPISVPSISAHCQRLLSVPPICAHCQRLLSVPPISAHCQRLLSVPLSSPQSAFSISTSCQNSYPRPLSAPP